MRNLYHSSRSKKLLLNSVVNLRFHNSSYGLPSLRSAGASAAANAGISDRLFKGHGRWKSDRAKDGYVSTTSIVFFQFLVL